LACKSFDSVNEGRSLLSEINPAGDHWTEDNSAHFLELGDLFVPGRAEQLTTLVDLLPAQPSEIFTVVELGAGAGKLARAVLEKFPGCHYLALDGSELMREHLTRQLASFRDRLEILPFELAEQAWRQTLPSPLRCVLSSLCVHHLDSSQKRQLFVDIAQRLETGGALLLADVVEPPNQRVAQLFARQYDEMVREQSLAQRGDLSGYEQFCEMKWNYFAYDYASPDPDPIDHPSPLSEQVSWLGEAGFSMASCFWMRAGHAIYGGYK
jgi:phospholipid N-methyltransferase